MRTTRRRRAIEKRLEKLSDHWTTSWEQERPKIEERLLANDGKIWRDRIVENQLNIDKLNKQKASLVTRLEKLAFEARNRNRDTLSATMVNQELASLLKQRDLTAQKLELLALAEKAQPAPDEKAKAKTKPKSDDGREAAERIETHLKELMEKLGKDASPVGNEVRKALERAVDEVHRSLQKEGMTPDDLRQHDGEIARRAAQVVRAWWSRPEGDARGGGACSQGNARDDGARASGGRARSARKCAGRWGS